VNMDTSKLLEKVVHVYNGLHEVKMHTWGK